MDNIEVCDFGCIGYAYVPIQHYDEKNIFSPQDALNNASLFPELVITAEQYGKRCTKEGGLE